MDILVFPLSCTNANSGNEVSFLFTSMKYDIKVD